MQWTIYSNKVPQLTWINNLKTQNCHIHSIKHCIQILFIQTQTSRKLFLQWLLKNMLIAYIWECMRATFKSRLNTGCLRYIYFPQKSNAYKSYFSWKYIHCDIINILQLETSWFYWTQSNPIITNPSGPRFLVRCNGGSL